MENVFGYLKMYEMAFDEAIRLGNLSVTIDHFVLALIRHKNNSLYTLLSIVDDPEVIKRSLDELYFTVSDNRDPNNLSIDEDNTFLLLDAVNLNHRVLKIESDEFRAEHILYMAISDSKSKLRIILERYAERFTPLLEIARRATSMRDEAKKTSEENSADEVDLSNMILSDDFINDSNEVNIEDYCFDITAAAKNGKLDPLTGRENELERVIQVLSRRKKNNPILIGEAGVGKSAIIESIADKIAKREVPPTLLDKRILSLDMGSLVAGTRFRGDFEERIRIIINELKKRDDVILFIDEIHTLVGAGNSQGSLDAANMLKPALARGEIRCVGATTLDEYRNVIEKDSALVRRFQKILVNPTNVEETISILESIKSRYEEYYKIKYTSEAIRSCVTLADRYITDRKLPDKAIDLLDEAGVKLFLKSQGEIDLSDLQSDIEAIRVEKRNAISKSDYKKASELRDKELFLIESFVDNQQRKDNGVVTEELVAEVVSEITGINVTKIAENEGDKLMKMADEFKSRIIGQDEAVEQIVKAIKRSRAGLNDPNRPIGSFLFLGPTGVGKSELAKTLAEYLFDSRDNIIRLDMSEYMDKISITRLIGAPPGYVGYNQGGELSEKVKTKPYSVVLLDEIEKAHSDIFNLLLQVLDDGRLTDSNGKVIDFKNTILIMTSNVGSRELKQAGNSIGFVPKSYNITKNSDNIISNAVNKIFTPEFLNRLDAQITFNSLTKENIRKIVDIELDKFIEKSNKLGYKITILKSVRDFIADVGYEPNYGARPLRRAIQKYLKDPLSEIIIASKEHKKRKYKVVMGESAPTFVEI